MGYTAVSFPTSQAAVGTKDTFANEQTGLHRSHSAKDLFKRQTMRRSFSETHISCSINRDKASSVQPKLKTSLSMGIFPFQLSGSILPDSLRSFLFDPETSKDVDVMEKDMHVEKNPILSSADEEINRANWVERLMEIRSQWKTRQLQESMVPADRAGGTNDDQCDCEDDEGGCMVDYNSDGEGWDGQEMEFDRDSFSNFLDPVTWSDTKLFSQLAFLSNMAYVIPDIKATDLRRYYGLQFVTSSLEKKADAMKTKEKLDQDSTSVLRSVSEAPQIHNAVKATESKQKHPIRPWVAYEIAASAASYIQSRAKDLLSIGSEPQKDGDVEDSRKREGIMSEVEQSSPLMYKSEVAAYVAASTMTAVVAAGEEEKQEAAKNLQSLHSSPCEWFVCDDYTTYTRCFVIQGSDSLASWQANLFFEPTKFEDTDTLVHRGIYEAAKGIYEQFMPEIVEHLQKHGERARLQFTGHSLGGSLSLLISLMLLSRKVIKPSTLLPVVTFGSPYVLCGGQKLLDQLGLDGNHIHTVMMHRDIVPRAFSCNYPDHVAVVLKRLNGSFRSHPCLKKHKLLYSPIGKLFILQPDEKTSPTHPLLPPGSGLYTVDSSKVGYSSNVVRAFLNQPHPLQTLSDPTAYGSEGTILRDHDSSNYLKAVNGVLRQHTKTLVRRVRTERNLIWPLLASPSPHSWSREWNLDSSRILTNEIMTGV